MSGNTPSSEATILLERIQGGDRDAAAELLPLVYRELRAVAGRQFSSQAAGHTLQPTALVHEAFVKMVGAGSAFNGRAHFLAVAATAMRQILVNHARDRKAQKRGGGDRPQAIDEAMVGVDTDAGRALDVLDLNAALEELKQIDERKHTIVEMRFFGGLTVPEVAEAMKLSVTTIESEWRAAKAWLATQLS